ncbi:hypothetical protein OIV83_003711 [Microbotryomycetes sp. JL201]|nr:hypothetical protein OIV83_003711 [Microbotryomycetes sp. JL201]
MIIRQRVLQFVECGLSRPVPARCLASSAAVSTRVTRSRQPVRRRHPQAPAQPDDSPIAASEILKLSAEQTGPTSTADHGDSGRKVSSSSSQLPKDELALRQREQQPTEIEGNLPPASRLPVNVPHDETGVIDNATGQWADKLKTLLANPAIVVARELEMLNVLMGYEQANKYKIMSPEGTVLAYLIEEDLGLGRAIARQAFKTHRAFKATVIDPEGHVILIIRRPFSWINSRIYACTPSENGNPNDPDKVIGEAQQEWHLYRRKYNQFVSRQANDGPEMVQFGVVDEGFLAWDFTCRNETGEPIASISRNFSGIARELFTDTGMYVCRFEAVADQVAALPSHENPTLSAPSSVPANTTAASPTGAVTTSQNATSNIATSSTVASADDKSLTTLPSIPFDHRAVILATAISCDFDYFSRDRGGMMGSGFMGGPMIFPFPMGGGGGGAGVPAEGGGATGAEGAGEAAPGPGQAGLPREDDVFGGEDRGGGWGQSSANVDEPVSGQWNNDEIMQDPWGNSQEQQDEGGTWGWGDLFPGDGQDGGDGGDGDW